MTAKDEADRNWRDEAAYRPLLDADRSLIAWEWLRRDPAYRSAASKAAMGCGGAAARWVIGDTSSGTGGSRRTHILVKPSAVGLRTNLVITTDRRVYHVQLESTARTAMASISWTYPQDELLALRGDGGAFERPVAAGIGVDSLNFGYSIDGDDPPWRPVRAFDDGTQVFIEFPASLGQGEAPPLFVRGPSGRTELVNYRLRGRYYVVDRLFEAAELRLGERRQQVVRIVRSGARGQRPRRGRAS